jgi:hypothetical protein
MPNFGDIPSGSHSVGIVGGTKFARYPDMTTEETVNMMVTGQDSGDPALVNFSGYQEVLNFEAGEARGIFLSTRLNELIVVFGEKVFVITEFLGSRLVGTLNSTSGPVHISENFNSEIAIEDGRSIYIYNYSTSIFVPVTTDFIPVFIDFQDGYFIATGDDGSWYLSNLNNGLLWSPLDKQTLQTKADILQAAVVLDRQVWIMGQKASEIWYDQGLPPPLFPYVRENSLAIDYGALSRETIAEGFGMLVWLAKNEKSNPTIVFTNGGKPVHISTEGLDFKLAQLSNPQDSVGFLFQQDGHIFYQLTFNSDNFSIVYDFNTKMFYTLTNEDRNRHIAKQVVLFDNKLYFISFIDSKLYEMSTDITTYDGKTIPRSRTTKRFRTPRNDIFIVNRVNIQMEQGFSDPAGEVSLSISKDDGINYGADVVQTLKPLGVRRGQVDFWRLGRADNITFQFRFWGKSRFVVTNSTMDIYS